MRKNKAGRPKDAIPSHAFHIYPKLDEYWDMYDAMRADNEKSITRWVISKCLPNRVKSEKIKSSRIRHRELLPTDLEKALMHNSISELRKVLDTKTDDNDFIFTSGKVELREIYICEGEDE